MNLMMMVICFFEHAGSEHSDENSFTHLLLRNLLITITMSRMVVVNTMILIGLELVTMRGRTALSATVRLQISIKRNGTSI